MKTKDLSKDKTIEAIELLKNQIAFNNNLNKIVRAYRKEHNITIKNFNGYWDSPTAEMLETLKTHLSTQAWMPDTLKHTYIRECGQIFGQVWSCAVNTYLLKDLHDCEKHLAMLERSSANTHEEHDGFNVVKDLENNRLNIFFEDIPEANVRTQLKHYGFKWSPYLKAWTRQLTTNAEYSLKRLLEQI
jgi:hypothetical protein